MGYEVLHPSFYDKIGERKINKTIQLTEPQNRAYSAICQALTGKRNSFTQVTTELINTLVYEFRSNPQFKNYMPARMYEMTVRETFGLKEDEPEILMETPDKQFSLGLFRRLTKAGK